MPKLKNLVISNSNIHKYYYYRHQLYRVSRDINVEPKQLFIIE